MEMRNSISHVPCYKKDLSQEDKRMKKLPKRIKASLQEEAREWDRDITGENNVRTQQILDKAEVFEVSRPARRPVSLRLDPFDISMIKRLARRKGVPHTQLIAQWLHEKVEQEKGSEHL